MEYCGTPCLVLERQMNDAEKQSEIIEAQRALIEAVRRACREAGYTQ